MYDREERSSSSSSSSSSSPSFTAGVYACSTSLFERAALVFTVLHAMLSLALRINIQLLATDSVPFVQCDSSRSFSFVWGFCGLFVYSIKL